MSDGCHFSRDRRPVACTNGGQRLTGERGPLAFTRTEASRFRPIGGHPGPLVRSYAVTYICPVEGGVAGRRADVLDFREMLRRFQAGDGDLRIARDMGASRKTVSKYRAWAVREGWVPTHSPRQASWRRD
jgi:hypothetical protein